MNHQSYVPYLGTDQEPMIHRGNTTKLKKITPSIELSFSLEESKCTLCQWIQIETQFISRFSMLIVQSWLV